MRVTFKSSESAEFERGRGAGKEQEPVLLDQRLHKCLEALTAASFSLELARDSGQLENEFVSKASKLLIEAMELLRQGLDGQNGEYNHRIEDVSEK